MQTEEKTAKNLKKSSDANLDCIHCGLCLPKCPTYQLLGHEADSPRGRIYLMQALQKGQLSLDAVVEDHLECCLGCRACESACPSGVRYELMLNETRARIFTDSPPSWTLRWVLEHLLPYPRRIQLLGNGLRLYQKSGVERLARALAGKLSEELGNLTLRLPSLAPVFRPAPLYRAYGPTRKRVGLLTGCVMPVFFPGIHHATIELLRQAGCDVYCPAEQLCCGALHSHCGHQLKAQTLATHNSRVFGALNLDNIVINSAGCGAAIRSYHHLFQQPPEGVREMAEKTRDICEFLVEVSPSWTFRESSLKIAYDDPCHLLHGQGVSSQPRDLLRRIPGLKLLPIPNGDRCCGSAGIYNLLRPELSDDLLEIKLEEILATDPDCVATGNPGCILQIQYGLRKRGSAISVRHPVEILHASLGRSPHRSPAKNQ